MISIFLIVVLFSIFANAQDTEGLRDFYAKCSYFENNGGIYMELQSLTGIFLRGQDLLAASNEAEQQKGLDIYTQKLYDLLTDDFKIVDSQIINNKQDFIDNMLSYSQSNRVKDSLLIESFPFFDCQESSSGLLIMNMNFNILEKANGKENVFTAQMKFEYSNIRHGFMLKQFQLA